LSQGEIGRRPETFFSQLFEGDLAPDRIGELDKRGYLERPWPVAIRNRTPAKGSVAGRGSGPTSRR